MMKARSDLDTQPMPVKSIEASAPLTEFSRQLHRIAAWHLHQTLDLPRSVLGNHFQRFTIEHSLSRVKDFFKEVVVFLSNVSKFFVAGIFNGLSVALNSHLQFSLLLTQTTAFLVRLTRLFHHGSRAASGRSHGGIV
jgi:hypothetical protein